MSKTTNGVVIDRDGKSAVRMTSRDRKARAVPCRLICVHGYDKLEIDYLCCSKPMEAYYLFTGACVVSTSDLAAALRTNWNRLTSPVESLARVAFSHSRRVRIMDAINDRKTSEDRAMNCA